MQITSNSKFKYRTKKIKYDQEQVELIYYEHDLLLYGIHFIIMEYKIQTKKGKMGEASLNYQELHIVGWALKETEKNQETHYQAQKNTTMLTIFDTDVFKKICP